MSEGGSASVDSMSIGGTSTNAKRSTAGYAQKTLSAAGALNSPAPSININTRPSAPNRTKIGFPNFPVLARLTQARQDKSLDKSADNGKAVPKKFTSDTMRHANALQRRSRTSSAESTALTRLFMNPAPRNHVSMYINRDSSPNRGSRVETEVVIVDDDLPADGGAKQSPSKPERGPQQPRRSQQNNDEIVPSVADFQSLIPSGGRAQLSDLHYGRPKTSRGYPSSSSSTSPYFQSSSPPPRSFPMRKTLTQSLPLEPNPVPPLKVGQFPSLRFTYLCVGEDLRATPDDTPELKVHRNLKIHWASHSSMEVNREEIRRLLFTFSADDAFAAVSVEKMDGPPILCVGHHADVEVFHDIVTSKGLQEVANASLRERQHMMSQYERATGQPESRAKRRRLDIEAEDDDSGRTTRTDTRSRSRRPPNHELFRYPREGKNAVTVRQEDYDRLDDGEFLNDVVIEFYLKHLITHLADEALKNQVHIFNSFFYEQLAQKDEIAKKGASERSGYDRVKKWTSKVDIFKKKYIFVPINENMHWYLALIYYPGALLGPEPIEIEDDDMSTPEIESASKARDTNTANSYPSMAENRRNLAQVLAEPESMDVDSAGTSPEENKPCLMDIDEVTHQQGGHNDSEEVFCIDSQEGAGWRTPASVESVDDTMSDGNAKRKIRRSSTRGKKVLSPEEKREKEERESEKQEAKTAECMRQCHIIILDSLHGRHTSAISRLKGYLAKEAEAKLKMEIDIQAVHGIHAKPPLQTNHCDCGIYLLYYVEVFLRDPKKYLHLIFNRITDDKAWFAIRDVKEKRMKIKRLCDELAQENDKLDASRQATVSERRLKSCSQSPAASGVSPSSLGRSNNDRLAAYLAETAAQASATR